VTQNSVSMVNTRRRVVAQTMKQNVPSTSVSRRNKRLVLLDSKHRLLILQQLQLGL